MKTLITILIMLFAFPVISEAKDQPFAPKKKSVYAKHNTKKYKNCKRTFNAQKCWR